MKYSVIIPAYNEAENIGDAIRALRLQNVDRGQFEIIVVDNNSDDDTYEIAKKAGADVVIKEEKKGTNMARQAGYKASRGEIVAFLDADSQPPPNWLERIGKDLSREGVRAVSGPQDYGFKGAKKLLDRFYTRYVLPNAPGVLRFIFGRKAGIIVGGNFATGRDVIEKIGGIPPIAFWGDDVAIAMLISRKVGRVLFDPDLTVKSSPRRFESHGLFRVVSRYIRTYLKLFFSKEFAVPSERTKPKKMAIGFTVILVLLIVFILYGAISPTTSVFGPTINQGPVDKNEKLVALTFDDGPYGEPTIKILDILKRENVPATFFLVGNNALKYPDIVKREIADGHVIGNHSADHSKTLAFALSLKLKANVLRADQDVYQASGLHPRFFRPPYGLKSPLMLRTLKEMGYAVVLWNDTATDYKLGTTSDSITKDIVKRLKPGAIIDLHDGRDTKINYSRDNLIEALPDIIAAIKKGGYTPVTLDRLLNQPPYF